MASTSPTGSEKLTVSVTGLSTSAQDEIQPYVRKAVERFITLSGEDSTLEIKMKKFKPTLISKGVNLLGYFATLSRTLIVAFHWLVEALEDIRVGYSWRTMDWDFYVEAFPSNMNIDFNNFKAYSRLQANFENQFVAAIQKMSSDTVDTLQIDFLNLTEKMDIEKGGVYDELEKTLKNLRDKLIKHRLDLDNLKKELIGLNNLTEALYKKQHASSSASTTLSPTVQPSSSSTTLSPTLQPSMSIELLKKSLIAATKWMPAYHELRKNLEQVFDSMTATIVGITDVHNSVAGQKIHPIDRDNMSLAIKELNTYQEWMAIKTRNFNNAEPILRKEISIISAAIISLKSDEEKEESEQIIADLEQQFEDSDWMGLGFTSTRKSAMVFGGTRVRKLVNESSADDISSLVDNFRIEAEFQLIRIRKMFDEKEELDKTERAFKIQLRYYDKEANSLLEFPELIRLSLDYLNTVRQNLVNLEDNPHWWKKKQLQFIFPEEATRIAMFLDFTYQLLIRINMKMTNKFQRINYKNDPSSVIGKIEDIAVAYASSVDFKNMLSFPFRVTKSPVTGSPVTGSPVLNIEEIRGVLLELSKTLVNGFEWFVTNQSRMFAGLLATVWKLGKFFEELHKKLDMDTDFHFSQKQLLKESILGLGTVDGFNIVERFSEKVMDALSAKESLAKVVSQLFTMLNSILLSATKDDMSKIMAEFPVIWDTLEKSGIGPSVVGDMKRFFGKLEPVFKRYEDSLYTATPQQQQQQQVATIPPTTPELLLSLKNEITELKSALGTSKETLAKIIQQVGASFDEKLKEKFAEAFKKSPKIVRHVIFLVDPLLEMSNFGMEDYNETHITARQISRFELDKLNKLFSPRIYARDNIETINLAVGASFRHPVYLNQIQRIPLLRDDPIQHLIDKPSFVGEGQLYIMAANYTKSDGWRYMASDTLHSHSTRLSYTPPPIFLTDTSSLHVGFKSEKFDTNKIFTPQRIFPWKIHHNNNADYHKTEQLLSIPFRLQSSALLKDVPVAGTMFVVTSPVSFVRDKLSRRNVSLRVMTHFVLVFGEV